MKRKCFLLFAAAVLLLACAVLPGCRTDGPGEQSHTATVFAMDTVMELTVWGDPSLLDEAASLIASLEAEFSVTDPDAALSEINRDGGGVIGADTEALLSRTLAFCERTDGALDPTVCPVVRAWGFTTGEYRIPEREELDELLASVGWSSVVLSDGTVTLGDGQELDFGAVAKGYAGDRVIELFREGGAVSALVNLGGNVQALGTKPDGSLWRVAVADPFGEGYAGVVSVADRAVVTSGGYERYFIEDGRRFCHIIDPATGMPADNGLVSVTVVGEEGLLCDALSTALFVMGPERAAEFWKSSDDFEAIFLTEDGQITLTEGLVSSFVPDGNWKDAPLTVLRHD